PLKSHAIPVLYNMSPVPEERPRRDPSRWRVLYNGTLTARKGVISLIRAWSKVQEECPGAELHLYGKDTNSANGGSMRRHLESLVPPESRSRVFFHGHVPRQELDDALATARVSVFPSFAEAFGLAPVDAMAAACPTIFTERCAGPEIIQHERT